jgi:hypothetical protein
MASWQGLLTSARVTDGRPRGVLRFIEVCATADIATEYARAVVLSDGRTAAYRRLFDEIESALGSMPVLDIAALAAFLDPNMQAVSRRTRSACTFESCARSIAGYTSTATSTPTQCVAVRAIRPPPESSPRAIDRR